jgi:glycosyltransferase involved in cell wall biosynthesis
MPSFNHARYLADSIEAVLNQSYNDFELLIIDDCSTDNSRKIVETFRNKDKRVIAIYNRTHLGVSGARNMAMKNCRGNYIAFCDADDIWERDKTKIQVECLQSRREYDVVFCDSIIIDENGIPTGGKFSSLIRKEKNFGGNLFLELCLSNFINTPTILFNRKCLEKIGLFDESFRYLEDWLYWIELARHFRLFYIDMPLVRYRVHSNSTYKDRVGYNMQRIRACGQIMDRFPDLPGDIKSALSYKIARDYAELGEKSEAFRNYLISLRHKKTNFKSLIRLFSLPFESLRVP